MATPNITPSGATLNIPTWYDRISGSYNKTNASSTDHMDDTSIQFLVPEGFKAKINVTLTVDDWGSLEIKDQAGDSRLKLSMVSSDAQAGPQGGHAEWTKTGGIELESGVYGIQVTHQNINYTPQSNNKSLCEFEITATKFKKNTKLAATGQFHVQTDGINLARPIVMTADLIGTGMTSEITNLKLESFDTSPALIASPTGMGLKVEDIKIAAEFAGETVIDSKAGIVSRTVRIWRHFRVYDPIDPRFDANGGWGEFSSFDDDPPLPMENRVIFVAPLE